MSILTSEIQFCFIGVNGVYLVYTHWVSIISHLHQSSKRHLIGDAANIWSDRNAHKSIFTEIVTPRILHDVMWYSTAAVVAHNFHCMICVFYVIFALVLNDAAHIILPRNGIHSGCDWTIVSQHFQQFQFIVDETVITESGKLEYCLRNWLIENLPATSKIVDADKLLGLFLVKRSLK